LVSIDARTHGYSHDLGITDSCGKDRAPFLVDDERESLCRQRSGLVADV
jgi:hypothetical protein